MNVSFNIKKIMQYLTVLVVAVVLLLAIRGGYHGGKAQAQAEVNSANANQVAKALDYFYQDQDRYPTADEFMDRDILGNYLSQFPVTFYTSGSCPSVPVYKRPAQQSYTFDVCLPVGVSGLRSGWNELTNSR